MTRSSSQSTSADGTSTLPSRQRSKLTNGVDLLPGVDRRLPWPRRFRDLILEHTQDLGGPANVSAGDKYLIRRCAALNCELELLEHQFAANGSDLPSLEVYQRASNSLRRILQALGLQRRSRDVTPSFGDLMRQDLENR